MPNQGLHNINLKNGPTQCLSGHSFNTKTHRSLKKSSKVAVIETWIII